MKNKKIRCLFGTPEANNYIYRPPNNGDSPPENTTFAVKFSNNIYLKESFLIQNNIEYTQEDLEYTPLGQALIIRPDKKEEDKQCQ